MAVHVRPLVCGGPVIVAVFGDGRRGIAAVGVMGADAGAGGHPLVFKLVVGGGVIVHGVDGHRPGILTGAGAGSSRMGGQGVVAPDDLAAVGVDEVGPLGGDLGAVQPGVRAGHDHVPAQVRGGLSCEDEQDRFLAGELVIAAGVSEDGPPGLGRGHPGLFREVEVPHGPAVESLDDVVAVKVDDDLMAEDGQIAVHLLEPHVPVPPRVRGRVLEPQVRLRRPEVEKGFVINEERVGNDLRFALRGGGESAAQTPGRTELSVPLDFSGRVRGLEAVECLSLVAIRRCHDSLLNAL